MKSPHEGTSEAQSQGAFQSQGACQRHTQGSRDQGHGEAGGPGEEVHRTGCGGGVPSVGASVPLESVVCHPPTNSCRYLNNLFA